MQAVNPNTTLILEIDNIVVSEEAVKYFFDKFLYDVFTFI